MRFLKKHYVRTFFILSLIVFVWMGCIPSTWIYNLDKKEGIEQGQKPSEQVISIKNQTQFLKLAEDFKKPPVTISANKFVKLPLLRIRDESFAGEHQTGIRTGRKTVEFSKYFSLDYPTSFWKVFLKNFLFSSLYNQYTLVQLEDGSYIAAFFDDYLLVKNFFGGKVQLPTGYIRSAISKEQACLKEIQSDYFVNTEYILDMYDYHSVSLYIDILVRMIFGLFVGVTVDNLIFERKGRANEKK